MIRSLLAFLFLLCACASMPVDANAQGGPDGTSFWCEGYACYDIYPESQLVDLAASMKYHGQTAHEKEVRADWILEWSKWCGQAVTFMRETSWTHQFMAKCIIAMEIGERSIMEGMQQLGYEYEVCELPNYHINRSGDSCHDGHLPNACYN